MVFHFYHLIAAIILTISGGVFYRMKQNLSKVDSYYYDMSMFLVFWTAFLHLTIAAGLGVFEYGDKTIIVGRYLEWLISYTMLLALLIVIGTKKKDHVNSLILKIMLYFDLVVTFAIFADFSTVLWIDMLCYGAVIVFLFVVFYYLFVEVKKIVHKSSKKFVSKYNFLQRFVVSHWFVYLIFWLFGEHGIAIIPPSISEFALIFLGVSLIGGFGYFSLRLQRA